MYKIINRNSTLFLIIPLLLLSSSIPFFAIDDVIENNNAETIPIDSFSNKEASSLDVFLEIANDYVNVGDQQDITLIVDNLGDVVNVTITLEVHYEIVNMTGAYMQLDLVYENQVDNLTDTFIYIIGYTFDHKSSYDFNLIVDDSDGSSWYDFAYVETYCEYEYSVDISLSVDSYPTIGESSIIVFEIYNDWNEPLTFDILLSWNYDKWNETTKTYDEFSEILHSATDILVDPYTEYTDEITVVFTERAFYDVNLVVIDSNYPSVMWDRSRYVESEYEYEDSVELKLDYNEQMIVGEIGTITPSVENYWITTINVSVLILLQYNIWNETQETWVHCEEFILNETNILISPLSNYSIDVNYNFTYRTGYYFVFGVIDENFAVWFEEGEIDAKFEYEEYIILNIDHVDEATVGDNLSIDITIDNNWNDSLITNIELWVEYEVWNETLGYYIEIKELLLNKTNEQINASSMFNQNILFNTTSRTRYYFELVVVDTNNVEWTKKSALNARYEYEEYIDIWLDYETQVFVGVTTTVVINIKNNWNQSVTVDIELMLHYDEILFNATDVIINASSSYTKSINITLSERTYYNVRLKVSDRNNAIWLDGFEFNPEYEYEEYIYLGLEHEDHLLTNEEITILINIENNWTSDIIVTVELWIGEGSWESSFIYFLWDISWDIKHYENINTTITSFSTFSEACPITFEEHGYYGVQLRVTSSEGAKWTTECMFEVRDAYEYGVFAWLEQDDSVNVGQETTILINLDNIGEAINVDVELQILGVYHDTNTGVSEMLSEILFNQSGILLEAYLNFSVNYTFAYHGMFTVYLIVTDDNGAVWKDCSLFMVDYLLCDQFEINIETSIDIIVGEPTTINISIINLENPIVASVVIVMQDMDKDDLILYNNTDILLSGLYEDNIEVIFNKTGHYNLNFCIVDDYGFFKTCLIQFEVGTGYYLNISSIHETEVFVGEQTNIQIRVEGNLTESIEVFVLIFNDIYGMFSIYSDYSYYKEIVFTGSFEDSFDYTFDKDGLFFIYIIVVDSRSETWFNIDFMRASYSESPTSNAPTVNVEYPNGDEVIRNTVNITWVASDPNGDILTYNVYYWNGTDWMEIAYRITNTYYIWNTDILPNGDYYKIKVYAMDGQYICIDVSDNIFVVDNTNFAPEVSITSPNGGENVSGILTISWSATDINEDSIEYSIFYWNSNEWIMIVANLTTTTYNWDTTTVSDGDYYKISIHASDGHLTSTDESDDVFTIKNTVDSDTSSDSETTKTPLTPGFEAILLVIGLLSLSVDIRRKRSR